MKRGGRREGAGRPKGARTVRTSKVAEKAIASGKITPLEVILKAMHQSFDAEEWAAAAAFAKDAAPYMHAKLASVQHSGPNGGPIQTADLTKASEEQLAALEAIFGPLAGSSADDEGDQSGEGEAGS